MNDDVISEMMVETAFKMKRMVETAFKMKREVESERDALAAAIERVTKLTDKMIQEAANEGSFPGEAVNEGFVLGAKWVRDGCPPR
jgi:hypothetical protein